MKKFRVSICMMDAKDYCSNRMKSMCWLGVAVKRCVSIWGGFSCPRTQCVVGKWCFAVERSLCRVPAVTWLFLVNICRSLKWGFGVIHFSGSRLTKMTSKFRKCYTSCIDSRAVFYVRFNCHSVSDLGIERLILNRRQSAWIKNMCSHFFDFEEKRFNKFIFTVIRSPHCAWVYFHYAKC